MKRSKTIIILLIVLIVVCIATFAINRYQTEQEQIREAGETVLEIATQDVTALSWENEDGEYSFTRGDDGWTYSGDEAFPVSTDKVEEMLSIFNEFGAAFIIENVTDYSQYGLDEPIATIHIETADSSYDISLGDYSQMDEERYVSIGDGNAYLATHDPMDEFDAVSDDLIENDTIPAFSDISSMSVDTRNESYTITYATDSQYSYDEDDVYFADMGGETTPLDPDSVSSYLSAIRSMDLSNFVNYKVTDEELSTYGLNEPDLTLEVHYTMDEEEDATESNSEEADSFVLSIARDPEEAAAAEEAARAASESSAEGDSSDSTDADSSDTEDEEEITAYARMNDSPIIYQITGDVYDTLMAAGYNDLRHSQLMTASQDQMTQIDITLEGSTYTLMAGSSGSGDDTEITWTWNGEEVDAAGLVSDIRAATVTQFSEDEPGEREEISLRVYLDDENFPEVDIVFYRHDGSTCLATVDGEPVGYVSRADVVDIIESVNVIVLD